MPTPHSDLHVTKALNKAYSEQADKIPDRVELLHKRKRRRAFFFLITKLIISEETTERNPSWAVKTDKNGHTYYEKY